MKDSFELLQGPLTDLLKKDHKWHAKKHLTSLRLKWQQNLSYDCLTSSCLSKFTRMPQTKPLEECWFRKVFFSSSYFHLILWKFNSLKCRLLLNHFHLKRKHPINRESHLSHSTSATAGVDKASTTCASKQTNTIIKG